MRPSLWVALTACLLTSTGCHSLYIETTVTNATATPFSLLEVDYPSASFGTQNLAPGASFHYRFKILGSGPTKLIYTDAAHHEKSFPGPTLQEGQEGALTIEITEAGPKWNLTSRPRP